MRGPGTDLGGLGWYLGIWVTMMAAMTLPSAAPAAQRIARLADRLRRRASRPAIWRSSAVGLVAYGLFRLATFFDMGWLGWDEGGPPLAGGAIAAAGIYELTPLKQRFRPLPRTCRPEWSRLRARLRRLQRRPDGRALRPRRDESRVDGGRRRRDLVEKVLPRGGPPRPPPRLPWSSWNLDRRLAGSVPGLTELDSSPSMRMEM